MTVDVNVLKADEAFLDDIDEIIEDTMVQIFVLKSENEEELEEVKEHASNYSQIFYYAPLSLKEEVDANCLGFLVASVDELDVEIEKPLFIEDSNLKPQMIEKLLESSNSGIILNATKPYLELESFFISIGALNFDNFESGVIAGIPMSKIVLQSSYPEFGFEEIFPTVKRISDEMFRPDQSIIAQATKNSLQLFGFKK